MLQSFIERCGCNGIYDVSLDHNEFCPFYLHTVCKPALLMTERHWCPHFGHEVWISVNDRHGRTSWSTNAEKRRRTCEIWLARLCVCVRPRCGCDCVSVCNVQQTPLLSHYSQRPPPPVFPIHRPMCTAVKPADTSKMTVKAADPAFCYSRIYYSLR